VTSKTQICGDQHGITNPRALIIACRCVGCEGALPCDGLNSVGTQGFLICTTCGCMYTITATKEAR